MRAFAAVIVLAASSGCVYGVKSLPTRPVRDGVGLPADAAAESARRKSRQLWSVAGGALELGVGALLRYAATQTHEERNARVFDGASQVFLVFGAGDVALAAADSLVSTPFVDELGAFQRLDHFEASDVAPSTRLQADTGGAVSIASQHRVEGHYDVAYFHWYSPRLRMRYQLGFDRGIDFAGSTNVSFYGIGGGASIEWNPGERRHFGRHPQSALVAMALPRAIVGDGDPRFGWRALVGWELGRMMIGVGATQIVGIDRFPGGEVWFGLRPLPTD